MRDLVYDKKRLNDLQKTTLMQLRQLKELGLILHEGKSIDDFKDFKISTKPGDTEIIFIFAGHNPRAKGDLTKLEKILKSKAFSELSEGDGKDFRLRFFASSSAGYVMHESYMVGHKEFLSYLEKERLGNRD